MKTNDTSQRVQKVYFQGLKFNLERWDFPDGAAMHTHTAASFRRKETEVSYVPKILHRCNFTECFNNLANKISLFPFLQVKKLWI